MSRTDAHGLFGIIASAAGIVSVYLFGMAVHATWFCG